MLKKWLEVDISASWEKLFQVIDSPAVSADRGEFFEYTMCVIVLNPIYIVGLSCIVTSKPEKEKRSIIL